jgi:hypothetical protein
MGAGVATGVAPEKSGSKGYQYIVVVGAFGAAFFGKSESGHNSRIDHSVNLTYSLHYYITMQGGELAQMTSQTPSEHPWAPER